MDLTLNLEEVDNNCQQIPSQRAVKQPANKNWNFKKRLASLAELSLNFQLRICDNLCLVPLTRNSQGEYISASLTKTVIHESLKFLQLLNFIYKINACIDVLEKGQLDIQTYACISVILVYIINYCFGVGLVWRPQCLAYVLNSRPLAQACALDLTGRQISSPFSHLPTTFKSISLLFSTGTPVVAVFIATLMLPRIPGFYFPVLFGWAGDFFGGGLPSLIISSLLETTFYTISAICANLAPIIFLSECGLVAGLLRELEKIKVVDLETWNSAIKFYKRIELHHKIVCNWVLYLMPIALFAVSIGILLGLYGMIRFTFAPLLLYAAFPVSAILLMTIFVGITYDMVSLQLTSEKILDKIRPNADAFSMGLSRGTRAEFKLRASILKPIMFPVGRFTNVSFNVTRYCWEEILNQLILLLSF